MIGEGFGNIELAKTNPDFISEPLPCAERLPFPLSPSPLTISFELEFCRKDHRLRRIFSAPYPNHRSHQLYRGF